jgi:hypothetical protein
MQPPDRIELQPCLCLIPYNYQTRKKNGNIATLILGMYQQGKILYYKHELY